MADEAKTIEEFREVVRNSSHIIVLAGAGLSAASGIPTYTDGGGMWRSLDATSLATPGAFAANPALVWQFYLYRRTKALQAQPNEAHRILAKLSVPIQLKKVAPKAKTFHLITQNIDRLSQRALEALNDGITDKTPRVDRPRMDSIAAMHGSLFDISCTKCGHRIENLAETLCPNIDQANLQDYRDAGTKARDLNESDLPHCDACGALARPGVVWFEEKPLMLDEINLHVYKADLCIVIGTSSTVRPASTFAYRVRRHGGKVALFNLQATEADGGADFVFRGPCETTLPQVFPELI